jgi:hypothetical protein
LIRPIVAQSLQIDTAQQIPDPVTSNRPGKFRGFAHRAYLTILKPFLITLLKEIEPTENDLLKNVKPEESLRMYLSMPLQHRDIEQKVDDHFAAREQELAQITDRAERQVAIEQHPDRNRSVNLLTKL